VGVVKVKGPVTSDAEAICEFPLLVSIKGRVVARGVLPKAVKLPVRAYISELREALNERDPENIGLVVTTNVLTGETLAAFEVVPTNTACILFEPTPNRMCMIALPALVSCAVPYRPVL
jgi:hypothetical protein